MQPRRPHQATAEF